MSTALPNIALDPLAEVVATVELRGVKYDVLQITGAAYNGALALKIAAETKSMPDPELLFRTAKALVPSMPAEIADSLTINQAMAILLAAVNKVGEIERLYPKGARGGSRRKSSPPPTR